MKIGKIISLEGGPIRNVTISITASEIFCEISDPSGSIDPSHIVSFELAEAVDSSDTFHELYFRTSDPEKNWIRFYTTREQFDLVLLLDALEAVIGPRPRASTKRNAEQDAAANP